MNLTPTQLTTLRADINADPALNALYLAGDRAGLANAYNAASTFYVWRQEVTAQEVMENGFIWTAVDGLTNGKARIWDWLTRFGTFNPSKPNVRQGLADAFGVGSAMANAILPHLRRPALRIEKLFATGTGTEANPGQLVVEGEVTSELFVDV